MHVNNQILHLSGRPILIRPKGINSHAFGYLECDIKFVYPAQSVRYG